MSDTIREAIEQQVLGPATVSVDGSSVTAKNTGELIDADRYLAGQQAVAQNHLGLRFFKLEPPRAG